jgi:hypothetical protein
MRKLIWFLTILIVILSLFLSRDFTSRYQQPINGDAKGYYAYLPALFIYHDSNYEFVDKMESTYYLEDGSLAKGFRNKQPNGTFVNKCFPGLAILYLPFFFLSALASWIMGIPIDGYSMPFQLGIVIAHYFYFFLGLYFLSQFLLKIKISFKIIWISFICITFGTNVWYYLIYDHSVSHIFNFFLFSLFIWIIQKWIETKNMKWSVFLSLLMALIVITRPTNAIMILFTPFIFRISNEAFLPFLKSNFNWKKIIFFSPFFLLVLAIPPLLWKWQTNQWLVYSYNEEGFNFFQSNWWNYLFSYKKGWFLWSPMMFLFIITTVYLSFKASVKTGISFILPFIVITYVLSSWWCWTYGTGMGQRTMIDFYPIILIGFAYFIEKKNLKIKYFIIVIPLLLLNLLQNFQIFHGIQEGGKTTSKDYWGHFLDWKTIAPDADIKKNWILLASKTQNKNQTTNSDIHFTDAIDSDTLDNVKKIVIELEISAKHEEPNLSLVVSSNDSKLYRNFYLGNVLYEEPRKMSIAFDIPKDSNQVFRTYIWNGDSNSECKTNYIKVKYYTY